MNRSFQSIAALLISLAGAMLAVTWIPADGPQRATSSAAARRRAVTVPCGHLESGNSIATAAQPIGRLQQPLNSSEAGRSETGNQVNGFPQSNPTWNAADIQRLVASCPQPAQFSLAISANSAFNTVMSAFGESLRPLWPLQSDVPSPASEHHSRPTRNAIESEYAAAELAAAGLPARAGVSGAMKSFSTCLQLALETADRQHWQSYYSRISAEFDVRGRELVEYCGYQDSAAALWRAWERHQHRLALREALLRELDRRFLEAPILKEGPALPKPRYLPRKRRMYIAAADALRTLAQWIGDAAQELESASREDVAELHTPVENRDEKR